MAVVRKRVASLSDMFSGDEPAAGQAENDFISEIIRRVREGRVIPVVSGSVFYESVFRLEAGDEPAPPATASPAEAASAPGEAAEELPAEEQTIQSELSSTWARQIGYPLPDQDNLARVAQYNRTLSEDNERAKVSYLRFLKMALLNFARVNGSDSNLISELRARLDEASFTDLCQELGYPQEDTTRPDPLRVLARLPLPVYITTSYHDYLERLLALENRRPRTQICFWSGETLDVDASHAPDRELTPSVAEPVVYHLMGLERYPSSIALSEDDYLDFLARVVLDTDTRDMVIPLYLRDALSFSSLVLLGYRLSDWDFRVLFRGVILPRQSPNRWTSLIIQLTPEEQYHIAEADKARKYLETYFSPRSFKIEWGNAESYLAKFWSEWKKRQV